MREDRIETQHNLSETNADEVYKKGQIDLDMHSWFKLKLYEIAYQVKMLDEKSQYLPKKEFIEAVLKKEIELHNKFSTNFKHRHWKEERKKPLISLKHSYISIEHSINKEIKKLKKEPSRESDYKIRKLKERVNFLRYTIFDTIRILKNQTLKKKSHYAHRIELYQQLIDSIKTFSKN